MRKGEPGSSDEGVLPSFGNLGLACRCDGLCCEMHVVHYIYNFGIENKIHSIEGWNFEVRNDFKSEMRLIWKIKLKS